MSTVVRWEGEEGRGKETNGGKEKSIEDKKEEKMEEKGKERKRGRWRAKNRLGRDGGAINTH